MQNIIENYIDIKNCNFDIYSIYKYGSYICSVWHLCVVELYS